MDKNSTPCAVRGSSHSQPHALPPSSLSPGPVGGPRHPQVAVFDTAFHQTMPQHAYMYGLPYEMYEQHRIRRYGFHGTSHKYLVEQAAEMLAKPAAQANLVTCHLGQSNQPHRPACLPRRPVA